MKKKRERPLSSRTHPAIHAPTNSRNITWRERCNISVLTLAQARYFCPPFCYPPTTSCTIETTHTHNPQREPSTLPTPRVLLSNPLYAGAHERNCSSVAVWMKCATLVFLWKCEYTMYIEGALSLSV